MQAEGDVAAAPAKEGADEHGVGAAGRIDDVGEVGGRRSRRRRGWWGDERGPVRDGGDSVAGEEASEGAEQLHGSCYLLQEFLIDWFKNFEIFKIRSTGVVEEDGWEDLNLRHGILNS